MKMDLHIHSSFSDGLNTPEEIVKCAIELGYEAIGITDHVRKNSTWVEDFVAEIKKIKQKYEDRIRVFCCVESKVINLEGDIDFQPTWSKIVDLVFAAFHEIPNHNGFMSEGEIAKQPEKALDLWTNGMLKVLKNPLVHVIAHPGSVLKNYNIKIPRKLKEKISFEAKINNKIFEINGKYNVPDKEFLRILKKNKVKLIFGSDSHSTSEMNQFHKLAEKYNEV
ncbi:MAG: hypothetical protein APZ16_03705 [Candidatus Hadarchaeum yellowstonense]|uniref:Polymerase/histidinol phosphatase N-terminal domain-containing protein n=1 Tax=Hadarchaeum yellowstonense TaxID=1776334 RepID=A0A147K078_HADYE|nr:MAG: hypothetical protein APZ16_03705 [Candidatus Hadarchaeum yellowstonense]